MKLFSSRQIRLRDAIQSGRKWAEAELLPQYQRLSLREQRLVLAAVVAFPVAGFVFGIWLPVKDEAAGLRTTLPKLEAQWREADTLATRLQQNGKKATNKRDILSAVEQAAKASSVRSYITRIKPQAAIGEGQQLLVYMRKAPYDKLVRFLARVAKDGLGLGRAKLLPSGKPSLLDVELLVVQG